MRRYFNFLLIGLILGLFTELQLKLVARINPPAFIIAIVGYPVLLTISYAVSRLIDRSISTTWKGDVLHYAIVGFGGLAIEWVFLGNGPESNAIQLGMFAMWTTFAFGPRILTRSSPLIKKGRRRFSMAFAIVGVLLTLCILMVSNHKAKIVIAVLGLSGSYVVWSVWLLLLAWRNRHNH